VELIEYLLLFLGEGFLQVLVMPCHISEQLFHLFRVRSAVLLGNDISVPQSFNNIHRLIPPLAHAKSRQFGKENGLFENALFFVIGGVIFGVYQIALDFSKFSGNFPKILVR
jgi:hypothetical protein